ncbi:hypothetical protein PAHAL_5G099100 [Panicum hallii]|uniref:No apical meristem-associated C-terminal domain-containing protein n=1 Tax=Panicum hallii TaxID=206008 RepID=A0A2T8IJH2_9POAL|nr:hypothetical protein PAHAL_5G099100 [Panicum hallii]
MENVWQQQSDDIQYTACIDLTEGYATPEHHVPAFVERQKKGVPKRSKNFSPIEDETLCSAYLNVSKDPIIGINQSITSYWNRITDYYNENRKTPSERIKNSLQHRWSGIQKDTVRFCGFYAEIERKRESGKSEDDKVKDALQMYQGLVKSAFKFIHCWLILRYEHKWQAHLIAMSTPKDKERSETLQATKVQAVEATKDKTLPPKISRPIGRDKAKRMKPSNTASNSTAFLQVLQNMRNRSASL